MVGGPITNEDYRRYEAMEAAKEMPILESTRSFVDGAVWSMSHPDMDMLDFIFYHNASFTRYEFFTKKLWKKVKGFKNAEQCEVHAAFLHWWLEGKFGLKRFPIGCTWCGAFNNEESHNKYLKEYEPVFEAYQDWCYNQR